MKKMIALAMACGLCLTTLAGCGSPAAEPADEPTQAPTQAPVTDSAQPEAVPENTASQGMTGSIVVVSREDGSGTRGAFIELLGIEEKDADGNKVDNTTVEALIANATDVMMTQVAGNKAAIGYISLGSLNPTVKALMVDGVAPSTETVKDGTYKVARPFNIATSGTVSDVAQDFINFILSAEGQEVVSGSYIKIDDAAAPFTSNGATGKIVVAGSSSVTPVMEKLKEAYCALNAGATIEVQMTDSSAGMRSAIDGVCDIGMASRELKDSELEAGLTATAIALDGIAVVVNPENPLSDMSSDMIKQIYVGAVTNWEDVK